MFGIGDSDSGHAGLFRFRLSLLWCWLAAFHLQAQAGIAENFELRLTRLHSQRESAFDTWLEVNARLPSTLDRLSQLRAAKREALGLQGISLRQLGEFRRWDEGKSKPIDHRTIERYAR